MGHDNAARHTSGHVGWSADITALITASSDAIIGKSLEGVVTDWNPAAETMYGYSAKEIVGQSMARLEPPGRRGETQQLVDRVRRGEPVTNFETTRQRKDGTVIDVATSLSPVRDATGAVISIAVIARDITENKRVMRALAESQDELRDLAKHLLNVREAERTRLAREIHDGLGQALTALKLDTGALRTLLPEASVELKRKLYHMTILIDSTIAAMRTLATDLRPSVLDDFGLAAAVEGEVARFAERTGIQAALDMRDPGLDVNGRCSTTAFRVIQEALTNVARHAQATIVTVRLDITETMLQLSVADNGSGITVGADPHRRTLGLVGMRERVASCGGELVIEAVEPHGTRIVAHIPVSDDPDDQ